LLDHESTRGEKLASEIAEETGLDLLAGASETTQIYSTDVARDSKQQLWWESKE
jgi:hypothetical protein